MMRYWQLTKENGREMLGMLRKYIRSGYLWQMKIDELGNEVYEFIIVPNYDFNYSEKVKKSQWAMDVFGQELHMGDYLVERDNKLAVLTAEAIKELEEEDEEKMRDEEQSQEATECQKKVLLKQLLEAYNKHNYTRSTILHNELMKMGMTENEIRAKINALIGAKSETKEVDIKTSSTSPIDELQKILVRRAQLQKELAEIEETLTQKYEIKVNNTENK